MVAGTIKIVCHKLTVLEFDSGHHIQQVAFADSNINSYLRRKHKRIDWLSFRASRCSNENT